MKLDALLPSAVFYHALLIGIRVQRSGNSKKLVLIYIQWLPKEIYLLHIQEPQGECPLH